MTHDEARQDRFRGLIWGTAVGDALGLPAEGLSRRRAARMFQGHWRHRFLPPPLPRRGMVSDDTDHTMLVAQSLLACPDDPGRFAERLARGLKWWLAALPAGVGLATLRAGGRLWVGIPPGRSGVFSAGNGPAMRSAPIGAFFASDPDKMARFVGAATRISHTDPRALTGAMAVARLTARSIRLHGNTPLDVHEFLSLLASSTHGSDSEWRGLIGEMGPALGEKQTVAEFADRLGFSRGITGYAYSTVPVAAYAWQRHFGDFRAALTSVLDCGGDTDTTGAIVGAMVGAVTGETGIPKGWIDGIWGWPLTGAKMRRIADRLASVRRGEGSPGPVRYFLPGVLPRNLIFMTWVLAHGLRRLLPPY